MSAHANPKIVTDGLVLCLEAGDGKSYSGSGTTWTDRSGNGNHGTLTNGPTFSSDNNGLIQLDGTNDNIRTLWGANHNPYNNPITVSCWFKIDSITKHMMILSTGQYRGNANGNQRLYFGIDTGISEKFGWGIYADAWGNNEISGITANTSDWFNVTIVVNNTNAYCYINNVLRDTKSVDSSYVLNDELWVGTHDSDTDFELHAKISNVMVYEKDLSEAERTQNFNVTKSRFGL
jgi:hypothetical protein